MSDRIFNDLLEAKQAEEKFVCVGLDPDLSKIAKVVHLPKPIDNVTNYIANFNAAIVAATKDLVCAYKPNMAFYERYGPEGLVALQITLNNIRNVAPDVPVILDAKRGDIGNSNEGYVCMAFDSYHFAADAITLHPYLGKESLEPFLKCKNKGLFILCRTSNPGAGEFQDREVLLSKEEAAAIGGERIAMRGFDNFVTPLYRLVAHNVAKHWNYNGNCGLVVGATFPEELASVRAIVGNMPILAPGIGTQGGDLEKTVLAGKDNVRRGVIINLSRSVLYASQFPDFAEAARKEVQEKNDSITRILKGV